MTSDQGGKRRLIALNDEPFQQPMVVQADEVSSIENLTQLTQHDSRVAAHDAASPELGGSFTHDSTGGALSNLTFWRFC